MPYASLDEGPSPRHLGFHFHHRVPTNLDENEELGVAAILKEEL